MLGAGVIVLPGVSIGNHVVIGAGAVVASDISDGVVAAGCPAKVVGDYWSYAKKRMK